MMASPALSVTSCDRDVNEEVQKLGYSTVPTAFPFSGPSRDDLRDRLDKEFRVPQSLFIAEGIKLRALKLVAITISRGQNSGLLKMSVWTFTRPAKLRKQPYKNLNYS